MGRFAAVLVGAAVLGSAAVGASRSPLLTATAVCPTRAFTVDFDPKRRVLVTDGARALASASFTARTLSKRCRRVGAPSSYNTRALGPQIRARTGFRCAATQPIRIHMHPLQNDGTGGTGSVLFVGIGSPRLRVIVSAVLTNSGGPLVSRLSRAAAYCKLGA